MFLTHFALSTAIFLGMLQNETQHLHNPYYVEELKVVTEKIILNSKTEKVYESKEEGLDTQHRKKRELEMTYEPACLTKVSKVAPKFAEGYNGENKTVLNGNTPNKELNKFIQFVDFVPYTMYNCKQKSTNRDGHTLQVCISQEYQLEKVNIRHNFNTVSKVSS